MAISFVRDQIATVATLGRNDTQNGVISLCLTIMKLHIQIAGVDEHVEVRDATEALQRFKAEASKRAPFLLRAVIKGMSDLGFAAEAVKRDNARTSRNDAAPRSAQEFLDWAIGRGYVRVEEA